MPGSDQGAYRRTVTRVLSRFDSLSLRQTYPSIYENFSVARLSKYSQRGPFFGHYMLWRLATLQHEQLQRLNALLDLAGGIPGWARERKSLVGSAEFGEFWSVIWQLQIAEYLSGRGIALEWGCAGPDLVARRNGKTLFVECYAPRAIFDVKLFLEDVLRELHPQLRVWHQVFCPVSLPRNAALETFLSTLIASLDEPGVLTELVSQAKREWPAPIQLPPGSKNIFVYVEGPSEAYCPGVLPQGGCDPGHYLQRTLRDAVLAKVESNRLVGSRPNVLAVNLLLEDDQRSYRVAIAEAPDLLGVIDELVVGTVGIDDVISPEQLQHLGAGRLGEQWLP